MGVCGLSQAAQASSSTGLFALLPLQVRAMRLSFVGEMGWELHVPRADCVKVYRAVMEAGARHGITNAGYRAIDSLSIEKGPCSPCSSTPCSSSSGGTGQGGFSQPQGDWRCGRMLRIPLSRGSSLENSPLCGLLSRVFYPRPSE